MFAKEWFYISPEWEELVAERQSFLSEKVILQYVGYVKTHMSRIKSGKYRDTPREKKIFYSVRDCYSDGLCGMVTVWASLMGGEVERGKVNFD